MLFNKNKEFNCEQCNAIINKKTSCTIDYSHQNRYKNGKVIRVCQKCCIDELLDGLQKNSQKAVIVQPSSKYNAYGFYSFKLLTESAKHSWDNYSETEFYKYMQSLLPSDHDKCNFCSNDAIYTWCDLRIYCGEDPFSVDIPEIRVENTYVCQNCIGDLFRNKIVNDKINLTYVFPMLNESGYYTPWEA